MKFELFRRLHKHSGPVCQYFDDPLNHLGRVITRPDNSVAVQFGRVLKHQVEGILPRFFAQGGYVSGGV